MGYFTKFAAGKGISFMEGAEKMDVPVGVDVHVADYGYIKGEDSDFAVLALVEYPGKFMFANSILTGDLKVMDADFGTHEKVLEALSGVALRFAKKVSKKGREYMAVEFIESVD